MVDERVYVLDDNTNMILVEHVIYNDKRYLLLNKEDTDDISIAYEENNKLVFMSDDDSYYHDIALMLLTKLEKSINKDLL